MGKRFGFARVVNVKDERNFATKLDNIIIGSEKIMVNLPRFNRHDEVVKAGKSKKPLSTAGMQLKKTGYQLKVNNNHAESQPKQAEDTVKKSNKDNLVDTPSASNTSSSTVTGDSEPPQTARRPFPEHHLPFKPTPQNLNYKPPPRPKRTWAHRHYTVEEEELQKLSSAYVGELWTPGLSYRIQEECIQQGYFSVRATPLGTNLVLLESLEEGEMEALLEDAQEWLSTWFLEIKGWNRVFLIMKRLHG